MEDFLKKRKVPAYLADRVRVFFQHILSRQIVVDETSIINGMSFGLSNFISIAELSLPLRTELILYLYRDILGGVPFFKGKDPQFIVRIVPLLKLEYYGPVSFNRFRYSKERSGRVNYSTRGSRRRYVFRCAWTFRSPCLL